MCNIINIICHRCVVLYVALYEINMKSCTFRPELFAVGSLNTESNRTSAPVIDVTRKALLATESPTGQSKNSVRVSLHLVDGKTFYLSLFRRSMGAERNTAMQCAIKVRFDVLYVVYRYTHSLCRKVVHKRYHVFTKLFFVF